MKNVIIIGTGGSSKVIYNSIKTYKKLNILGFLDDDKSLHGTKFMDKSVLGAIDDLDKFNRNTMVINGVGATKDVIARKKIFNKIKELGFSLYTFISKHSVIADDVEISLGCVVMPGTIINSGTILEENVFLNTGVIVEHDCYIGESTFLATGCVLSGNVKIKSGTFLGSNSTVIGNVVIGSGSTIGAGSVVIRDVEDNTLVYGNPSHKNIGSLL